MIVYNKLARILEERGMFWKDLANAGIGINTYQVFKQNKNTTVETVDLVCQYLGVQPGDIMECIPDDKRNDEREKIKKQIKELQEKLKSYE